MQRTKLQSVILYVGVILTCAVLLFPIYWMAKTAISPVGSLRTFPPELFPADPQFGIFALILEQRPLLLWIANSAKAAIGTVVLSMTVSVFAAYSLSRFRVKGSGSMGMFILVSKMLPATLMVIPLFVIFRELRLIGSIWSLVLAHATLVVPFSTWMLKGYFDTIPRELEQAALVDGCSPFGALFRVVLPIATPGLAATALYGFVLSWADFAYARTFLTNAPANWTANVGIATLKGEYVTPWNEVMAASLIAAVPIVIVYMVLERYLVGGLTAGSEK